MSSKLGRILRFAPWLMLALVACYFIVLSGWEDAQAGRLQRKAEAVFHSEFNEITEARIYLLMGEESQWTSDTFPCGPEGDAPIYGSVTLRGTELEQFLEKWQRQLIGHELSGMCHDPAYGFRLYKGERVVTETSVCWKCSNFTVNLWPFKPDTYGFLADSDEALELLSFCDTRLPYKRAAVKSRPEAKISLMRAASLAGGFLNETPWRGRYLGSFFEIDSITPAAANGPNAVWQVRLKEIPKANSKTAPANSSPEEEKPTALVIQADGTVKVGEFSPP